MNVTMKKVLCLAVMALSACTPVHNSGLTLHYDRPAEFFEEALPIGNGRIGAMVYGAASGEERLSLNDITLWSGEPDKGAEHPDMIKFGLTGQGVETLAAVREALSQEDYRTAEKLQRGLQGHYSESYLPLGNLRIKYLDSEEVSEYERSLD
ncbi:MAG: glycoside hydrolase N-terminal domain-containing protein, partial [Bacteroidales bacterium]|nr:glycoside hydrolase N-terminal domain-containing protein [Bacteroidales bacterium]